MPETGCNILNSATTFYNYSPDRRTRQTYIIFDGESHLQSENYSTTGYTYTGTCLSNGDLVYKPELQVYFQIISIVAFFAICKLVFRLLRGRL